VNRELVEVRLSVENNKINFELVDSDLAAFFNVKDVETYFPDPQEPGFPGVRALQIAAQKNTKDRKQRKEQGANGKTERGQRLSADDYKGEPVTIHPGIHLRFNGKDQICWFSDQKINFVIDVGPDPELYLLQEEDLDDRQTLTIADLTCEKEFLASGGTKSGPNNPFTMPFPRISKRGEPILSGPLVDERRVRDQRLYKYMITVLGTPIVLDPHIEGHDG
jgi:hypothetical protein